MVRIPDQDLRRLAHKARSVPLPSVQHPDSAVSLNPDSAGWIRIPDQDLRRKNWLIKLGLFIFTFLGFILAYPDPRPQLHTEQRQDALLILLNRARTGSFTQRLSAGSIATLPPFGPTGGQGQLFFPDFQPRGSQKNWFAFINFGKIQFLPPCIGEVVLPLLIWAMGSDKKYLSKSATVSRMFRPGLRIQTRIQEGNT